MNQIVFALLSFGLIFFLMMSIAKGRQSHHYIMVVFVNICVAAGLGLNSMVAAARKRLSNRFGWVLSCSLFLGLISIQIVSALNYYPYYFNYTNPLMESLEAGIQTPVSGYGEGLELAASYLAEKPGAEEMIVMSFRGVGPFSYYFPGNTENMFASENWSPSMIDRLRISDYMVIYYYHQVRRHMPEKLLRDIASIEPEHTIWINGVEYVRIYPVRDLPETVFVPDILD